MRHCVLGQPRPRQISIGLAFFSAEKMTSFSAETLHIYSKCHKCRWRSCAPSQQLLKHYNVYSSTTPSETTRPLTMSYRQASAHSLPTNRMKKTYIWRHHTRAKFFKTETESPHCAHSTLDHVVRSLIRVLKSNKHKKTPHKPVALNLPGFGAPTPMQYGAKLTTLLLVSIPRHVIKQANIEI